MSLNNIVVTNQALAEIGTRSQIIDLNDGSQEANYANLLYNPLRDFLLREGDYEFASSPVVPTAIATPSFPWLYAYQYPLDCVRVKQLIPAGFNILDPQPVEFNIANSAATRAIVTKQEVAIMVYTTNGVSEAFWDPMFTEAMVRMLASALAFALENRIELSNEKLQEAVNFAGMASLKDG
jgi:hypothetical protein